VIRFKQKLTGPEYAEIFVDTVKNTQVDILTQTFVTDIAGGFGNYELSVVNSSKVEKLHAKTIILATGCRERTPWQIGITGTKPAGVMTAGTAQYFINIMGLMVGKKCVILGSGDIGLIMARRLTLEGSEVLGVYEVRPQPSGLYRNVQQCLTDFDIPLHLKHTVTRLFGEPRLSAVEIAEVDENFTPIAGTEKIVECDTLILSVGLIPENEIAEKLGVQLDPQTKGPICDKGMMTNVKGVFCCGNAYKVYDLVDYVSDCAEVAAKAAVELIGGRK